MEMIPYRQVEDIVKARDYWIKETMKARQELDKVRYELEEIKDSLRCLERAAKFASKAV